MAIQRNNTERYFLTGLCCSLFFDIVSTLPVSEGKVLIVEKVVVERVVESLWRVVPLHVVCSESLSGSIFSLKI